MTESFEMNVCCPIILWNVRCLHRERKEFFDRTLQLDPSALTADELSHLLAALASSARWHEALAYRQAFREMQEQEVASLSSEPKALKGFSLPYYFEDDNGRPIWIEEVMEILTGETYIVPGRPESVFRLGPSPILCKEEWTVQTANSIAHFLTVCAQLGASRFLRDRLCVTRTSYRDGREEATYEFPKTEATSSGLLLIRQLYSDSRRDDAFRRACETYEKHAGNDMKRLWVKHLRESFEAFLKGQPTPRVGSRTRKQVLDLVIYGSGLVHTQSDNNLEQELGAALGEHGCEFVATAFHFCCRGLYQYVLDASYPMMQDLRHWIDAEGCVPPDRPNASRVFGRARIPPTE